MEISDSRMCEVIGNNWLVYFRWDASALGRPPFCDLDAQASAVRLRRDVTLLAKFLKPSCDRPFVETGLQCNRFLLSQHGSVGTVRTYQQKEIQPNGIAHPSIVLCRRVTHEPG